jgi:prolyl-tRNA synthetase
VQVVVLAVKEEATAAARGIGDELIAAGLRVTVDDRTDQPYGRRAVNWELKGVPIRIEVGPRDLAAGSATVVRRLRDSTKTPVNLADLTAHVVAAIEADQAHLLAEATARQAARITAVSTVDEAVDACASGWARLPYDAVGEEGEDRLAESGVTVRCLQRPDGSLPVEDNEPELIAYVARSY